MHPAPQISMLSRPSAPKPRARLSEAQVIAIFQVKGSASPATRVAAVYGVSEKAVRDIWKGRTWSRETWHLDTSRPLQLKLVGRPKGCKDSNPRKMRAIGHDDMSLTARVLSRPHIERDGVAEHTFQHAAWQMPPNQQECPPFWHTRADSGACIEDSGAVHRSSAA